MRFHGLSACSEAAGRDLLGDAKGNFPQVKLHRHRNPTHREFITEWPDLPLTMTRECLPWEKTREDRLDAPEQIDVAHDSVEKIVFEVTTHMRGGLVPEAMMMTLPTAITGVVIAGCCLVAQPLARNSRSR